MTETLKAGAFALALMISELATVLFISALGIENQFVQVLINYSFDARNKKLPLWLVVLHAAVFLALNLFTFSAWYDIFAFVAAMLFVLCVAQSNAKHYRILGVLNSFVWIAYDIFAKAYGNLFVHIILLASNWVAILLRDKKKTKSL